MAVKEESRVRCEEISYNVMAVRILRFSSIRMEQ